MDSFFTRFFGFFSMTLLGITFLISCTTFDLNDYDKYNENDLFNKAQLFQQSALTPAKYEITINIYELYLEKFESRPDRC